MSKITEKNDQDTVGVILALISFGGMWFFHSFFTAGICIYVTLHFFWYQVFNIKASRWIKVDLLPKELEVSKEDVDIYYSLSSLVKLGACVGAILLECGVSFFMKTDLFLFVFSYFLFYGMTLFILKWKGILKFPFTFESYNNGSSSGSSINQESYWSNNTTTSSQYSTLPGNIYYSATRII